MILPKGQLILKGLFDVFNSFKKADEKNKKQNRPNSTAVSFMPYFRLLVFGILVNLVA